MTEESTEKAGKHERIRFRRDEIVDLSALPSAQDHNVSAARAAPKRGFGRALGKAAAILGVVAAGLSGALYYFLNSDIGSEQLRAKAEAAIEAIHGHDVDVAFSDARFGLHGPGLLNLDISDVKLSDPGTNKSIATVGRLRMGVGLLPLLSGNVQIASVQVDDAEVATSSMSGGGPGVVQILDANGLIDPDLLLKAVFAGVDSLGKRIGAGETPEVALKNVRFQLAEGLPFSVLTLDNVNVMQSGTAVELAGQAHIDDRAADLSMQVDAGGQDGLVEGFDLSLTSAKQGEEGQSIRVGDVAVSVAGARPDGRQQLQVTGNVGEISVDLGTRGQLDGKVELAASLVQGSGKVEVTRLNAAIGNSVYRMNGAVGPKPSDAGERPVYRFEIVSNNSELAPVDTNEEAMPMGMKLAGVFGPQGRQIDIQEIAISSQTGTAMGNGSVTLAEKGPPGMHLALDVAGMSVSNAKQLWPWFAAESARRWVNANLATGTVPIGHIEFRVEPGRLGNGKRLGNDEVFGRFEAVQTRVNTFGDLPPISGADGVVSFSGDDVEITLSKGLVLVDGGHVISVEDGQLTIKDAGHPPVLGDLQLKLAGPASAIARLASTDPINVMGRTGIAPEQLSGTAQGTVKARIPMQKGIDRSLFSWDVDLAYRGLSVAKQLDGQTVTDATGTLNVDTTKAVFSAQAKLNGLPATIDLIEPISPQSGLARKRTIEMALDDKTTAKLGPALAEMLNGPVKVKIDASTPGRQRVEADLTRATFTLPVVGWSKGSGIPAKASFDMNRDGQTTTLSDFSVSGDSFGIAGTMTANASGLNSAKFSKFRLNRDDNVSLTIDRSSGGYSVTARGEALDARPFIKRAMANTDGTGAKKGPAVTLKAVVGRMVGFNGENLGNVNLAYSSSGRTSDLSVEGRSERGKPMSIASRRGGEISIYSEDAGAMLRFLDIYPRVQGGQITVRLKGNGEGGYAGKLDASDFLVVNEPKLGSIVSAAPENGSIRKPNTGARRIDTSRVQFDRAVGKIALGKSYLKIDDGVLRGPTMGTTFQGTLYDQNNRMEMTGTFMPAYGLNSIFGDIPVVGALLGNGDDKGLIGVTYKLTGNTKSPQLQINPLSVVAPGIFRSIFEFR